MALINTAEAHDNSGTNFSSISLPATSLTTGNLIVVGFSTFRFFAAAPTGVVTDTAGNTYTLASSSTDAVTGFNAVYLWYCENANGHASNVVTITYSAQSSFNSAISAQYSTVFTSGSLDATNSSNQLTSTTSHTSGAFTTIAADELIVVYAGTQTSTDQTFTAGTGYTMEQAGSTTALEDKTVGSIQTGVTADISGNNSVRWLMVVATFKLTVTVPVTETLADTISLSDALFLQVANTQAWAGTALITYAFLLNGNASLVIESATAAIEYDLRIAGQASKILSATAIIEYDFSIDAVGQSAAVPIECIAGKDELPNPDSGGGSSGGTGGLAYMT